MQTHICFLETLALWWVSVSETPLFSILGVWEIYIYKCANYPVLCFANHIANTDHLVVNFKRLKQHAD